MSPELTTQVRRLWNELERISTDHEEVTDPEVRENLALVLHHHFVLGEPLDRVPTRYGMGSAEGNALVADAVEEFLNEAMTVAEEEDIAPGADRLAVLQDDSIETNEGETYETFIGDDDDPLPAEDLPGHLFGETGDEEEEEVEAEPPRRGLDGFEEDEGEDEDDEEEH